MDTEDKEHLRRIAVDVREIKQAAQFVLALVVLTAVGGIAIAVFLS